MKSTPATLLAVWMITVAASDSGAQERPRVGYLRLTTMLEGAQVLVDGRQLGTTPLRRDYPLAAGSHMVTVRKLGYLEFTERFKVASGEVTTVFADLLPFSAVVRVRADIKKARVLVDGTYIGVAPIEFEVQPGERWVTVHAEKLQPFDTRIEAEAGIAYDIDATLLPRADDADLDLALMPLEGPITGPAPPASDDDSFDLMPLENLLAMPADSIATRPVAGLDWGLQSQAPSPTQWYTEWWVWAAASAVVIAAVTVGVAVSRPSREDASGCAFDACLGPEGLVMGSGKGLSF